MSEQTKTTEDLIISEEAEMQNRLNKISNNIMLIRNGKVQGITLTPEQIQTLKDEIAQLQQGINTHNEKLNLEVAKFKGVTAKDKTRKET